MILPTIAEFKEGMTNIMPIIATLAGIWITVLTVSVVAERKQLQYLKRKEARLRRIAKIKKQMSQL